MARSLISSAKYLFPYKTKFTGSKDEDLAIFGDHNSAHYTQETAFLSDTAYDPLDHCRELH
jgi:hypothetical protein